MTEPATYYSGRRRRLLLAALVLSTVATSFPTTLLSASLDVIKEDLNSDLATISWVQIAPNLAFGLAMPLFGKLGDLYGHRRVFLAGSICGVAAAALTALAWNPISLITLRVLGMLSGAATGPAAFAMIATALPESDRGKGIGLLNSVGGVAPVVGVVVGGPLVDSVGWRMLFVLHAIPTTAALLMALPVVPETRKQANVRFDAAGAVTLAAGMMGLLLAVNRARPIGPAHPFVLVSAAAGVALLVAFVVIERRVAAPLLPLKYLRGPGFRAPVLTITFSQASFIGGFVITPLLLQRTLHYSVARTSLLLICRPLSFAVGSWVAGRQQSIMSRVAPPAARPLSRRERQRTIGRCRAAALVTARRSGAGDRRLRQRLLPHDALHGS